jgi:hypothetical protein
VASHYVQAWLGKYLKHRRDADRRLLTERFEYLEPGADGEWAPVGLERAEHLSFYFCSRYAFPRSRRAATRGPGHRRRRRLLSGSARRASG